MIITELQKYVNHRLGPDGWRGALNAVALLGASARAIGESREPFLEGFGVFIVPAFFALYGPLIEHGWRTLDVLEHSEDVFHGAVRRRDPGSHPPYLSVSRT